VSFYQPNGKEMKKQKMQLNALSVSSFITKEQKVESVKAGGVGCSIVYCTAFPCGPEPTDPEFCGVLAP